MLEEAKAIHATRKEEVSLFINTLIGIYGDQDFKNRFEQDVLKIFNAQGYLLLYNAIEAITSYIAKDLYEELSRKNIDLTVMPSGLRMTTFQLLRSIEKDSYSVFKIDLTDTKPDDVSKKILQHCYKIPKNKEGHLEFFSGNVDARVIRDFFEKFGFQIILTNKCQDCGFLLQIKNKRNHLAHGSISFVDEGRAISVEELIDFNERTFAYLECVIQSVEAFLLSLDSESSS